MIKPPVSVAILGDLLDFTHEPVKPAANSGLQADPTRETFEEHDSGLRFVKDGLLLIEDGHITARGTQASLERSLPPDTQVIDHRKQLVLPGFIDTHVHYPQCEVIASYGTQLLDWLNTYTFPAEARFNDEQHAAATARFFLDELMRNGTTTALVFGTVHAESVDAFFSEAQLRGLRMICGKVLMDRNAPDNLTDTPLSGYEDSLGLINRWHNKNRLGYAITPRFAPTSSNEQLAFAGRLKAECSDVHVHTHLSENNAECEWVSSLFPERKNYLDVYDHHGLLGRRSVFAHCIHLDEHEWRRLAATGSNIAHCPTSNLFIGSGLFNLNAASEYGVRVGLATDVGGGDSFSMLRTINEAYKIQQLRGNSLSPLKSLYLATLGGAKALDLDSKLGNFDIDKEADFIVLNESATPLMAMRRAGCNTLAERLFTLTMLGDDRCVSHTYIQGNEVKAGLAQD